MVLAIIDDLIFAEKLEASARQMGAALTVARNAEGIVNSNPQYSRILIDLNLSSGDPLALIRNLHKSYPQTPLIGYCSHVQKDLQQQALEAGCASVMPRSAFVQLLPELLK